MSNPTAKLVCYGCLLETPISSGVEGSVYTKSCPRCKASKKHVVRTLGFKVEGFVTADPRKSQMLVPPRLADFRALAGTDEENNHSPRHD